jgi:hypothetical protein
MDQKKYAKYKAIIEDVAQEVGGRARTYSGRGMYGKVCMGIVCDSATTTIETAAEKGLKGALTDGMGLQVIVYWPSVTAD